MTTSYNRLLGIRLKDDLIIKDTHNDAFEEACADHKQECCIEVMHYLPVSSVNPSQRLKILQLRRTIFYLQLSRMVHVNSFLFLCNPFFTSFSYFYFIFWDFYYKTTRYVSEPAFSAGIEIHELGGTPVRKRPYIYARTGNSQTGASLCAEHLSERTSSSSRKAQYSYPEGIRQMMMTTTTSKSKSTESSSLLRSGKRSLSV